MWSEITTLWIKIIEKKSSKIIKNKTKTNSFSSDMELLSKIWEAKSWNFYDFNTSYNNWLKKLKF